MIKSKFYAIALALLAAAVVPASVALADTLWATSTSSSIYNTNSGNVGIGTITPTAKLDVQGGNVNIGTTADNGRTVIIRGANATINSEYASGNALAINGSLLYLNSGTTANVNIASGGGSVLFPGSGIWQSTGNVGIGTTGPNAPLEISRGTGGGGAFTALRLTQPGASIGDGSSIDFYTGAGSMARIYSSAVNANKGDLRFAYSNGAGTFADAMTILNTSGNVGIGTTTPTQALEVVGNIKLSGNLVSDGDICIGTCP